MSRFRFAIIAIITLLAAMPTANASLIRDNLISSLSRLKTPQDSIARLFDIFDLSSNDEQAPVLEQLYVTARHANDTATALRAIRQLANCYMKDVSKLEHLMSLAYSYNKTADREETIVFLKLCKEKSIAHYGTDRDRIKLTTEAIQKAKTQRNTDIYDRIEDLASICIILGNNARGPLYDNYFERSAQLIDSINSPSHALRNMFYAQMVITYDNLNESEKTIAAARRLLEFTKQLEEEHHKNGRIYRNFNTVNYLTYRRMLGHADALKLSEVDEIYNHVLYLASICPDVKDDLEERPIATAYYHMAHKEYAKALPLLIQSYNATTDRLLRPKLLRSIIRASRVAGDTEAYNTYSMEYIDGLERLVQDKEAQEYREFEILYDVNNLRRINSDLVSGREEAEVAAHNSRVKIYIYSSIALLIMIVLLLLQLRRYRKQSVTLAISNHDLTQERSILLKTRDELIAARDQACKAERTKAEFINHITHEVSTPLDAIVEYSQLIVDCSDAENSKYLARYADVIKLSTDLLRTLVNDALDVGALDSPDYSVKIAPASLQNICRVAVDAIRPNVPHEVKLIFANAKDHDETINTDAGRVEQVLNNLLTNAAKFTRQGSITLEYTVNRGQNNVSFTVTDTGIGIPKGKEKVIFERFEKLNPHIAGSGLGLSICALIARLLNGTIYAEPKRRIGARFVFTIPLQG